MLTGLASGREGEIRFARPEVTGLAANAEAVPDFHVQANPGLDNAGGLRFARVGAAVNECLVFTEMSEASAEADPGRKRRGREQIESGTGSNEKSAVVDGNDVGPRVQV